MAINRVLTGEKLNDERRTDNIRGIQVVPPADKVQNQGADCVERQA